MCELHPTYVISYMNTTPIAYRLSDNHFGAFVNGKQVCS